MTYSIDQINDAQSFHRNTFIGNDDNILSSYSVLNGKNFSFDKTMSHTFFVDSFVSLSDFDLSIFGVEEIDIGEGKGFIKVRIH